MKEAPPRERVLGLNVPWPALVVLGIGFVLVLNSVDQGDAATPLAALQSLGPFIALLGVGGLLSVALQVPEGWRAHAARWILVTLGGVVLIVPSWGSAAALAVALFGLSWTGGDDRY